METQTQTIDELKNELAELEALKPQASTTPAQMRIPDMSETIEDDDPEITEYLKAFEVPNYITEFRAHIEKLCPIPSLSEAKRQVVNRRLRVRLAETISNGTLPIEHRLEAARRMKSANLWYPPTVFGGLILSQLSPENIVERLTKAPL
jgi:hypothetical protein